MKCSKCNADWNAPSNMVVTKCPFCQADLVSTQFEGIEGIFMQIVNQYGIEIYKDSLKFKSLLADFMAKDKKMLKLLTLIIDQQGAKSLLSLATLEDKEFDMERRKLIVKIAEDMFATEENVEKGVNLLCLGLGKSVKMVFSSGVSESSDTSDSSNYPKVADVPNVATSLPVPEQDGLKCPPPVAKPNRKVNISRWDSEDRNTLQLAQDGDMAAQSELGDTFQYDDDKKDEEYAAYWYDQSARQGFADAQYELGCCYEDGVGLDVNERYATYWYGRSAESGHSDGQYFYGMSYYLEIGVAEDYEKAAYWFGKSAAQGNAHAQCGLGDAYLHGEGLPMDYKKAVFWYEKSMLQDNSYGQFKLGMCYLEGTGIEQDVNMGMHLIQKSADAGNKSAIKWLNS